MTQENKNLLLQDFSARLPYGVNVEYTFKVTVIATNTEETITKPLFLYSINTLDNMTVSGIDDDGDETICFFESVKPYLRPMSSMTDEEKFAYRKTQWVYQADYCAPEYFDGLESYDWLNKNHFDYRGLIEKGLAIEAPEGMYN